MQHDFAELAVDLSGYTLRRTQPGDAAAAAQYHRRNRAHLATYSPVRVEAFYTSEYWTLALEAHERAFREGRQLNTFLVHEADQRVVGELNLANFVRGAFQAAYLGYSLDQALEGQGLMTRAVEALVQYAFTELHLHRVMANYVPSNERSARLLARCGFVREGFAQRYLLIAGRWQDHVLTARVAPDWTPLPA
jgi:ribosomal-protein-alanine N-acetyltransferase